MKMFNSFKITERAIQKVGTSRCLLLPAKELRERDLDFGDRVNAIIEPVDSKIESKDLVDLSSKFKDIGKQVSSKLQHMNFKTSKEARVILARVQNAVKILTEAMDEILS